MKSRVQELEDQIIFHKNLYYQGNAKISDEDFDRLETELKDICPSSPVLKMVGASPKTSSKIKHNSKMLSLEKTYDVEKLKTWIGDEDVVAMFKYDGSACSLVYENGLLVNAKTRGDGLWGEDILTKVLYIEEIPKRIETKELCEVRGEIYCKEEAFINLSKKMEKIGLDRPTSLRNIVAGLLGRKDYHELTTYLSFTAFEFIELKIHITEEEKLKTLKKYKFQLPEYIVCSKWTEVENQIQKCQKFFNEGEFLIDGLVFIYNRCALANELGQTSHHPKHKLAFKFQGESKVTKITEIEWSISRNGRCTPVAIVEPVELSGATVSRVTLHHYGIVEAFQLKIGDEIEIVRSGEVIPKFLRVVSSGKCRFSPLSNCPSCNNMLVVDEHWLKCVNKICPQKIEQEILYFIKTIGIEDISEMRLKELLKTGLIKEIPDLYQLKTTDFLILDKVKDKLAQKFFDQIQRSKNADLVTFIEALGIEGLGGTKIQKIIDNNFNTLEKLSKITMEELQKIDGFAEKSSGAIVDRLREKSKLLKKLKEAGVIPSTKKEKKESERLKGLKFCITGTLSKSRDYIAEDIKKHSGIIQNLVNKETSYLVTNDTQSSSSKFVKAQKLGVPILSEEKLFQLITSKE